LPKGCICGHDHRTARNVPIDICLALGCLCDGWTPRCQNCGEAIGTASLNSVYDFCSRRCGLQLEYAEARRVAS
jgi:hypothetical protein